MYAVRVTRPARELEAFFDKLQGVCDKLIVYEHNASRIHVHFLIVNCQVKTDTLKNWIRSCVGDVHRSDWSFLEKDVDEKFITYMSKGKLDPVVVKGYDEKEVFEYRSAWVPKSKTVTLTQYTVKVEKPEERVKRQRDLLQPVIDNIKNYNTQREVVRAILQVIRKERIVVGRFKIRDFYDYVMNQTGNSDWEFDIFSLCTKT